MLIFLTRFYSTRKNAKTARMTFNKIEHAEPPSPKSGDVVVSGTVVHSKLGHGQPASHSPPILHGQCIVHSS